MGEAGKLIKQCLGNVCVVKKGTPPQRFINFRVVGFCLVWVIVWVSVCVVAPLLIY